MRGSIAGLVIAALALAGCAAEGDTTTTEPGAYDRYRELAPDDAPYLTAAEARDHATTICVRQWDYLAGSVPWALIEAYGCERTDWQPRRQPRM